MKTYAYKVITLNVEADNDNGINRFLDKLGAEGWDLVESSPSDNKSGFCRLFILKRELEA